ncbi:MAG: TolC family protein, partial [Acidobacteriaceae bacterium]
MKLLLAALLIAAPCAFAQQQSMPNMQMPSASSSNPDAQQPAVQQPATPSDPGIGAPLTGVSLTLDALLTAARTHNPTLRAAQAAIAESAGQARQAGMLPNPVIGYEGDQIRGGSYGGGEQGG